jgi:O-antigen/teichoic acid export membrane protein
MIAGQALPLVVSLVATHFVIRQLGEVGYGVLTLIVLIPNYFSYADLGMSMASTKFASEAFAEGKIDLEARIVRTASLIALAVSAPVAAGLILFSPEIIQSSKVPAAYATDATWALRIAAVTFLLNFLCSIVNTPQLTRLRMDLNTAINATTRIAGLIATPVVINLGYGLTGVATALFFTNLACLAGHLAVSGKLLEGKLFALSIERAMIRPLVKFGLGYVIAAIAMVLLMNGEKAILTNQYSTTELGYYGLGFTLATMLTMFSGSVVQALLPAFSQLQSTTYESRLSSLFSTGVRLNLIWLVPAAGLLFVVAEPFFKVWANERYGAESTTPFYILLAGVAFNIIAFMPYSSIMAAGRTDVLAKLFWIELLPHLALTAFLITRYGIPGAAVAWSVRATVDCGLQFALARRFAGVSFDALSLFTKTLISTLFIIPTIIVRLAFPDQIAFAGIMLVLGLCGFFLYCWRGILSSIERDWLRHRLHGA